MDPCIDDFDYNFEDEGSSKRCSTGFELENWKPPKKKPNFTSREIPRTRGKAKEEAETISNYQNLVSKNESLKVECKELKDMNKKLLEQNARLLTELKRICKNSESVEAFNNSLKREKRYVGVQLTTDTLMHLWNYLSKINFPDCPCTESD
ncbi:hypothetical protein RN001_011740 [Aquatica leii]|uniref:Uncharacterized protein n=1 Tax=Aquatica leii TaxID=1421715 RepID=A0AAN7P4K0_9COLE|nr:hypothetical protein RN001_011740 [Aquatica leii]